MQHLRKLAGVCATASLLTGCGGGALSAPSLTPTASSSGSQTFNYKGRKQVFHVPAGVKRVTITADGASGSINYGSGSGGGGGAGDGGLVEATISVTPGEKLAVFVGGEGFTYSSSGSGSCSGSGSGGGGYNGGGNGQCTYGGAGGGASDVRQHGDGLKDRVIVAGGGGGGGGTYYGYGTGGAGGSRRC